LTELIRFQEKSAQTFFTPKLAKISKKKGRESHLFFEANLEKKIDPIKQTFPPKQDKNK